MALKNIFFIASNDYKKLCNTKDFTNIIMTILRNTYEIMVLAKRNLNNRNNVL